MGRQLESILFGSTALDVWMERWKSSTYSVLESTLSHYGVLLYLRRQQRLFVMVKCRIAGLSPLYKDRTEAFFSFSSFGLLENF
ncbi:hypothetical protein TRV_08031 [Trichophyton verrucosum HKI 0517]|uniref:Uncharacterized protein n=1 Tax=Trichophyton verrucosum (strain HKI 0517) TaxID=663202 RepID=D4DLF7_TRIVH|nr:uncharacterized protein TRV_08031 [Trichophyton verrucosum HKI 0517]EFE37335.1 hypothetical protein TRV_08031 [Trichophyton verrucosum HKI 0517]